MPKVVAYTLAWSEQAQAYQLILPANEVREGIIPESPAWFIWLEGVRAFVFQGRTGRFTVRKESRRRGEGYWYAYLSMGKKLRKRYVGKTADVCIMRLEEVGRILAGSESEREVPTMPTGSHQQHSPIASVERLQTIHRAEHEKAPERVDLDLSKQRGDLLVATKLYRPRQRVQVVERTRLFTQLDAGLQGSLVLISAPVGFGKTTLVVQWISRLAVPVAWLSLETEENQPTRFLVYMIAALQSLDRRIGSTSLPPLHSPQSPTLETILALLVNELASSAISPLVLVLDDYHVIHNDVIHNAIIFLLEHLPSRLCLILVTRADPLLPLARWRVRGMLTEVRASDLRFEQSEARVFLQQVMQIELGDADLHLLTQRTEGWIAGLQLAALSLRDKVDRSAFLQAFSGTNRFILDYLANEVLAHQPEAILTFLLATCQLERMCASLCSAVLEGVEGYTSIECQTLLETLEKTNLFVNALDDEQHWYRYHQLFATVLQARLAQTRPQGPAIFHVRASQWYEKHGYMHEAIYHTLEVQDVARLSTLLEPIVWHIIGQGSSDVVQGWLEQLPESLEKKQPLLCLYHAAVLALAGQFTGAEHYLQVVEKAREAGEPIPPGEVAMVRMAIALTTGDLELGWTSLQEAQGYLSGKQEFWQMFIGSARSFLYGMNGDFRGAIQAGLSISGLAGSGDNAFTRHRSLTGLAFALLHLGQLEQAISICQQNLYELTDSSACRPPYAGFACILLATGLYERNELEAAKAMAREGIALCKYTGELQFLADGCVLLAQILSLEQIRQGLGTVPDSEVRELMQQAETLLWKEVPKMLWARSTTAYYLARLWILQGNLEGLLRLERFYPIDEQRCATPGCSYPLQTDARGLAYLRFGQQRWDSIESLLRWPLEDAEANGRITSLVRMLILQSMAYARLDRQDDALSVLRRAVQVGETERYISAFAELGAEMADLLQALYVRAKAEVPAKLSLTYLQELLALFPQAAPQRPISPRQAHLLTEREQTMLQLMGEGLSNAEIARKLIVEISTVKWHIQHIYEKLQVNNRTQAVLRARELGML